MHTGDVVKRQNNTNLVSGRTGNQSDFVLYKKGPKIIHVFVIYFRIEVLTRTGHTSVTGYLSGSKFLNAFIFNKYI